MLANDLNDWLTEVGGAMVDKRADGHSLTPMEQMVYEIWALDTQARNGGLSQYFCNYGLERWRGCIAAASSVGLTSFAPFADKVGALIAGSSDPYEALIEHGHEGDEIYDNHSSHIVRELRAKFSQGN
jgi:hypothetical protein